jgi:flavin-dependent dehydrogenase
LTEKYPSCETAFDVVIIGGAFAGASSALLLRRWLPDRRILIVERQSRFTRKVGEATVEVSACFLHRVLGLYDYLSREQLPKHGLRYWFTDDRPRALTEMTEIGPGDIPRLPAFQLDRSKLDEHLLALAESEGCMVLRPARVTAIEHAWPHSQVRLAAGEEEREITARWVIDASGRQGFIARRRQLHEAVPQHPTAALWGRWENVADLDGPAVMGPDPRATGLQAVQPSRRLATNHFCGYGWWCWVIPLSGGQTSIGVVYNKTLYDLPGSGKPRERYHQFVTTQPGLRELVAHARLDEDDFLGLGTLPYRATRYMDRGWGLVGDAASFMDPYYSPGLDHASISVYATARLIEDDLKGRLDESALDARIAEHNGRFLRSYERWIGALYEDKYELMGDAELLYCAYLVDTSLYYLFVVGPVYKDIEGMGVPPFGLPIPQTQWAYRLMRGFNRRLLKLARFRRQVGTYGRRNAGWHSYGQAFGLKWVAWKSLLRGLWAWLGLEREYLFYRLRRGSVPVSQPVPVMAADVPGRSLGVGKAV